MQTTINGQMLICMLAEWLAAVPTLELIQCNTDGITYRIHRSWQPRAEMLCRIWEATTGLRLEDVEYSRMWISTVSTYVAETTNGKLKQKGLLWHPNPDDYMGSIANANPPAFHKDLGNIVSIRAAVQTMVNGIDSDAWIRAHTDAYDFMLRVRCNRSEHMMLGEREMPRTLRYYVALVGDPLVIIRQPLGPEGAFAKARGVSDEDYSAVMAETGGAWDARVNTKNKSIYNKRRTAVEQGYLVAECNRADAFDWSNVNYEWYISEARKLIVDPARESP